MEPAGVIVKLAGFGMGDMVKLAVVEHPPVDVTVTFVIPAESPLAEVCVGETTPGGVGLQLTV
jgi:hypothetical protein